MKAIQRTLGKAGTAAALFVLAAALSGLGASNALAQEECVPEVDGPTVTITQPLSGTVYLDDPDNDQIEIRTTINTSGLLRFLSIYQLSVDLSRLIDVVEPFTSDACSADLIEASDSCSTIKSSQAWIDKFWLPGGVGIFTITARSAYRTKSGDKEGCDQEVVTIDQTQTVSVEYPAPPAVAANYLNSLRGSTEFCMGSVVREITATWNSDRAGSYGAPPGPYNFDSLASAFGTRYIKDDVLYFATMYPECRRVK
jgi:hypothetical protein